MGATAQYDVKDLGLANEGRKRIDWAARDMPVLASAILLAGLASLGLPGTSGFVSAITVFLGAVPVWSWLTGVSALGLVLTAGYILWMVQRTLFGPEVARFRDVKDVTVLEMVPVGALVIAVLAVGIYPAFVSDMFANGVEPIVESLQRAGAVALR